VIPESAQPGLITRMTTDHFPAALADVDPAGSSTRLKSVSAPLGLGGASWDTTERYPRRLSLRSQLEVVADAMADRGSGVLITVDEIHGGDQAELREIATAVQHCFRDDRPVAFVAAGLPAAVDERLLHDKVITFLRRADRHHLELLDPFESADALRSPIEQAGRRIEPKALTAAVDLAAGYPFMVQLVGWATWRQHPGNSTITLDDVVAAHPHALHRVAALVHQPSLSDLSDVDRAFLKAMAIDNGPSRMADITERLGVTNNYASQYRLRLLASELVTAPTRGYVDFALPYMREYLRDLAPDLSGVLHIEPDDDDFDRS
jgi:hypothetical protein